MANEAQPHCDIICLPVFGHIIYVCPPKDYKNEPIKINAAVIQYILYRHTGSGDTALPTSGKRRRRVGGWVGDRISCFLPGFNICDFSYPLSSPTTPLPWFLFPSPSTTRAHEHKPSKACPNYTTKVSRCGC